MFLPLYFLYSTVKITKYIFVFFNAKYNLNIDSITNQIRKTISALYGDNEKKRTTFNYFEYSIHSTELESKLQTVISLDQIKNRTIKQFVPCFIYILLSINQSLYWFNIIITFKFIKKIKYRRVNCCKYNKRGM